VVERGVSHGLFPSFLAGLTANDYCFVFELRDGLIHRVREYMDTARGHRMVFGEGA
jgi:hypothetical protein